MTATYAYNHGCTCDWCRNGGTVPQNTPSNGHSFGYDAPHVPPSRNRPATNTHGGGIDMTAVVGHAPEHRAWKPGDPAWQPVIAPTARLEAYVTVDAGVFRSTRIGERTWLMKKAHVGHDTIIGSDCEIAPLSSIGGECVIGDRVKLGQGAIVKPRVTVGDGAVIGMGAVVIRDVKPGDVVAGNPAHSILETPAVEEMDAPDLWT